jgi:integrase/recombinase XerD
VQVVDFEQNSNTPPNCRVSFAQPAHKKTYLQHTNYLENTMATAKSLTPAELEQVLQYIQANANAERNRLMMLLTVGSGMRVSEVAGLTIGDVQNADGTVRSEVFLAAERVKHRHARTVFLNTRLQQEIAVYVATRKWFDTTQPLFSTCRGQRCAFSANTLTQHFHYLYKRAGVKHGSSHSGRKTFLTSLASQGVSVFVLAALAGHKSITTTQKYVTVNDDVKRKCVELV